MTDYDFLYFCAAKTAADIIFNHVQSANVWMDDRRRDLPNPFYGQVSEGLMLKMYYSLPSTLMTPWGEWSIGGSGSGDVAATHERIFADLGAVLAVPVKHTTMGTHGPIYALRKAGNFTLPKPSAKHQWLSYEESLAQWRTLLQRYEDGERATPVAFPEWDAPHAEQVPSDTIKLRTGVLAYKPMVAATTLSLRLLLSSQPIAFCEIVTLSRKPNHKLFGDSSDTLKNMHLLDAGGHLDDSIRDIILASVEGDGLQMRLVNPVASDGSKT